MSTLAKFTMAVCLAAATAGTALAGQIRVVTLDVQRMVCSGCVQSVQRALQKVPGVEQATVDLDKKTAIVKFDESKTSADALTRATAAAGFPSMVRR